MALHFLLNHSLRLPDRLVQHIREMNYTPPDSRSLPIAQAQDMEIQMQSFLWGDIE
jgi:hypothetical protein